jgi:hypothetical protein
MFRFSGLTGNTRRPHDPIMFFLLAEDAFDGWQSEWLISSGKRACLEAADSTMAHPKLNLYRHTIHLYVSITNKLFALTIEGGCRSVAQ